jgi:hypothetical protein
MAFSLDDMLERMGLAGKKQGRECYREDMASLKKATKEEIASLFPNVTLSDSKEVIYAPFRLCHSLPKVNLRGRCFTPKVLSNSFASVRDAAMNIDHQMKYRNQGGQDTICGHIVCGRFDPEGLYKEEMASVSKLPAEPIPLTALAAFYLRSQHIPTILQEHLSNTRKWLTSMECSHAWDQAAFLYEGELIPIKDAEPGMRECVDKLCVRPFKGKQLALALGGVDGSVDFHAAALTPDPADGDAKITAFVTKDEYFEAASASEKATQRKANPFFFPLETRVFESPPEGSDNESVTEDELANISILGSTEACSQDGHSHDILTDGTVMSGAGANTGTHAHQLRNFNISRGSNPRLTGRTDTHYQSVSDPNTGRSNSHEHLHLVNISLKGKSGKSPTGKQGESTASIPSPESSPVPVPYSAEFPMDKLLERMLAVLSAGKFEGATATEVASLQADLKKTGQDNYLKQMVQTEVANQIAAGDLVKKEDHQKKLDDAVKAEKDKADKEKAEMEKRTARREKVLGLGLTLEDKFDDTIDMTVGQYVDSFGLDENSEKTFSVALATMAKLAEPPPAAVVAVEQTGVETQAANAGKKAAEKKGGDKGEEKGNKPQPRKLLVTGRGTGGEGSGEEEANLNKPAVGRKAFKTAV